MNKKEFDLKYPKGCAYKVVSRKDNETMELWFKYLKEAKEYLNSIVNADFVILKRYC